MNFLKVYLVMLHLKVWILNLKDVFLKVEVSSDESCSSYPPKHSGALVKPLSATQSTLREPPLSHPDIVRVRDLPHGGSSSSSNNMPVKSAPKLEPVSLNFNKETGDDSGKGGSIGAELEKFYAENRSLSNELQSVTTAFPGAVLDKELSPRESRYDHSKIQKYFNREIWCLR